VRVFTHDVDKTYVISACDPLVCSRPKTCLLLAKSSSLYGGTREVNPTLFLLLNVALAFYLVGAIWAIEVDIFRTWRLVSASDFHAVQKVHWRKLPFWVLAPLGLALIDSFVLLEYHPPVAPAWARWGNLGCQLASHLLTAIFWGPWQAKLSRDDRGPASPYLEKILATHWIRTLLINAYAGILLAWAILALGPSG
jgi:hypothetical protein